MTSLHCNLIHEGLDIKFPKWNDPDSAEYRYCCIADQSADRTVNVYEPNFWNNEYLTSVRELNRHNKWNSACHRCQFAEENNDWDASHRLFNANRDKLPRHNVPGPNQLTIKLSSVCNLMCTHCGPEYSTTWQQAVKKSPPPVLNPNMHYTNKQEADMEKVKAFFDNIDLSNLEEIYFTGGETLLGYSGNLNFKFLEYIATRIPLENITVLFHTNGTKSIPQKLLKILKECHFVYITVSMDCTNDKFNYLRYPAKWEQVEDNVLNHLCHIGTRAAPEDGGDFEIHVHQVISVLTLFYMHEVENWAKQHNLRYSEHSAGGEYELLNLNESYRNSLDDNQKLWLPKEYGTEYNVDRMIKYLNWYDQTCNLNWKKTFPEIAQFYSDYI